MNECVIAGYDAGSILYGAFLFGWLGIATVLGGGFLWLGYLLGLLYEHTTQ